MTSADLGSHSPVRLVIADVDGTLVTQQKVLTPRASAAVQQLRNAGIAFTITSGRPPKGMQMIVDQLQLDEPIAAFNGGILVNPDLSLIRENFLNPEVARQVIPILAAHKLDVWLYSDQDWFVKDPQGPHVAREQWTVKFPPTVVTGFDDLLARVAKIVGVSDDYDAVAHCEKDVQLAGGDHLSAARSQPYYLDVTHPNANKGQVVLMLSEILRIPAAQIATIGDMPNDVLMFRKSGISIAMGNASPEVQRSATFVTTSNEDEGFANAMQRFVLQPAPASRPAS
ncbi:MAG TPA: Cof-type HAD-IIB family hydrolase [Terriglobales bacterium]|nr:Cof-type HAD-IIB family hydrolase [Terriglobales bacterium]